MAASGLPYFLYHKSPSVEAILLPCPALYSPILIVLGYPRLVLALGIGDQVHFQSVLTQLSMTPVLVGRAKFS